MKSILNGHYFTDREAAHDYLARQLELPQYYGKNLDALWDVATTILSGEIFIINARTIEDNLGEYGIKILKVLLEAVRENEKLLVIIDDKNILMDH